MGKKWTDTKRLTGYLFLAVALLMLTLCGCTMNQNSDMSNGVLVDSPLGGIDYTSYTYAGITGADGGFKYFKGDPITFSVGGIPLGSAVAKPVMSLIDLVPGATDVTNQTVTNMARFLQSLDNDGNLSNGIFITQAVRNALKGKTIDFTLSSADFEASVASFFTGLNKPLMSAVDAQEHFEATLASYFLSNRPADENTADIKTLTILQTSDMHDHASGYGHRIDYTPLDTSDHDTVKGGYSRLAAKIKEIRSERNNKNVLLVDSGDFFMGTVYDLTTQPPVALNFFEKMGYDVVTLGNHEFDWSPKGLDMLLNAGIKYAGFNVPIVASTMDASGDDGLSALINSGNIKGKLIITTDNGLKIGIIGLEGENSIRDMPAAAPVTFKDQKNPATYAYVQSIVDELRQTDHVDLVIALSHSGIRLDGTGDDADWAANVDGIDIIASGHYHTATHKAFIITKHPGATSTYGTPTFIFSPGSYTRWLSRMDIVYSTSEKKIIDHNFCLIPIDDTIKGDSEIQDMVTTADSEISTKLQAFGLPADLTPVSSTSFDLEKEAFSETAIGNLSADAIRFTANQLASATQDTPYDIGIVASGVIRDGLLKGKTGVITFSDAYNVLPLGISPWDQSVPGYPMMSIYVTAPEIRNACEISASISRQLGSDFYLNFSGLRYKYAYNPAAAPGTPGSPGMTVWQVSVTAPDDYTTSTAGTPINLNDTTTLYRVAVDYYALQMMGFATQMGLPIVPKDADGNAIDPMDANGKFTIDPTIAYKDYRIDRDPATDGVQELKEWMPLLQYFQYFAAVYDREIPTSIYGADGTGFGRSEAAVPQG